MSATLTLTARGQFTFNKQLMEHLGVRPGQQVSVKRLPDGALKIDALHKKIDIMSLAGALKTDIRLTDAQLQEAIAQAHVQAGLRGLE